MPTHSRIRRKRGPAIAWTPTEDTYYELARLLRGATGATPLYLAQAAILEFEAHLRVSSSALPFGLLAGEVCLCPQTQLEYLLIDTVARARIMLTEDDPYAQLAAELKSLAAEQVKHRKLAIGWYLGGMSEDLTLDSDVTKLHRELFPERWQVALVRGESSGTQRGAFLRFETLWDRWYSIPFFEFISERGGRNNRERRTALRWANYRADEPARPLEEFEGSERRANEASRSWWRSSGFVASLPLFRSGRETPVRTPERTSERTPAAAPPAVSTPVVSTPLVSARVVSATAMSAPVVSVPARRAEPSAPAPVVTMPRPAAMTPLTPPEPLDLARPPRHAPEPVYVEPTEQTMNASAEVGDAPEVAVEDEAPEAPSDVQQIFIDGSLVTVPLAQATIEGPGKLGSADGVRISSLLIGALLLLTLLALYLIAR